VVCSLQHTNEGINAAAFGLGAQAEQGRYTYLLIVWGSAVGEHAVLIVGWS